MMTLSLTAVIILVECLEVGLNTVIKAAMTRGMSQFVFTVYSNALGGIILLPASLIFLRKKAPPKLTWYTIFKIFILSLLSFGMQIFMYVGMGYSSPTLASALLDLTPAFTFFFAVVSRMETLDLREPGSRAKSLGTVVSIAGALVVTLYKGQPITSIFSQPQALLHSTSLLHSNWVLGAIFLAAAALCLSLIFIVVTWIIKDYPAELIVTQIGTVFVTILSAIFALVVEKKPNAWRLKLDIELIAIGYGALLAVSVRSLVYTWACRKEGPIYVSMFKPLDMVIAIIMGVAFLGDTLYLGSVIGGAVITMGFYAVLWGQTQEAKLIEEGGNYATFDSSSPKAPLLKNTNVDVQV